MGPVGAGRRDFFEAMAWLLWLMERRKGVGIEGELDDLPSPSSESPLDRAVVNDLMSFRKSRLLTAGVEKTKSQIRNNCENLRIQS